MSKKTDSPPHHIGFIIDGNRRWAKKHHQPSIFGHKQGYDKLKKVGEWCMNRGIKVLTIYTFSTENWKRSKTEVQYLMGLIKHLLKQDIWELHEKGIRLKILGRIDELSKEIQRLIDVAEKLTKDNVKGTLNLAINYGGRSEIVDMVKSLLHLKVAPATVTESLISNHLYTGGTRDPEMIIRTSGEHRLSGFLPWQSTYSEFFFLEKLWPDFTEADLDAVLEDYRRRERRFGH